MKELLQELLYLEICKKIIIIQNKKNKKRFKKQKKRDPNMIKSQDMLNSQK